jgi:GTP-binding protein EngB required for normal cell division
LVQNLNLVPSKLDDLRTEKATKETQKQEWEKSRNIILIGRTGNGKSSLANVLIGDESGEKFNELHGSSFGTQHWQLESFAEGTDNYGVMDTVGIGDLRQNKEQVWKGMMDAVYNNNSLHQIFFVFKGRIAREEIETLKWLGDNFGQEIFDYLTFVMVGFAEFEDKDEVEKAWKKLWQENKELLSIVGRSVDNPPLHGRPSSVEMGKEVRQESRKVLLNHLKTLTNQTDFAIDSPRKNDPTINILTTRIKDLEVAKRTEEEQQIKLDELEQKLHSLQNDNNDTIEILRIIREDRARTELQRKQLLEGKGELGHQLEQLWLMLDGSDESMEIMKHNLATKEQELADKDNELANVMSVQREVINQIEKEKLTFEEQKLLTDVSEFLNKLGASVSSLSKEEIFREWKKLFDFYGIIVRRISFLILVLTLLNC